MALSCAVAAQSQTLAAATTTSGGRARGCQASCTQACGPRTASPAAARCCVQRSTGLPVPCGGCPFPPRRARGLRPAARRRVSVPYQRVARRGAERTLSRSISGASSGSPYLGVSHTRRTCPQSRRRRRTSLARGEVSARQTSGKRAADQPASTEREAA